jgi:TolB-like protein/cytochrome c-type biogenesis protein CcmH/NrfG
MQMSLQAERDPGNLPGVSLPPDTVEIRDQLERIVASPQFPATGRGAAFLRYVVEETLAGRAERIKGYSVAIEVFKRDHSFTQDDPVVRIEAGRLRKALEWYYLVEGQHDPVRIDMPKGGYVPHFARNEADPAPPADSVPSSGGKQRVRWLAMLVAGGFGVALLLVNWISGISASGMPTQTPDKSVPDAPTLVVAPFADLGSGPEAKFYTAGLTEELLSALPRFKELKVFGRETSNSLSPQVGAARVRAELGARYLLVGGVRVAGGRVRVTARLLETDTDVIVWSQIYDDDLRSRGLFAIQSDVAARVATAVAQPYGAIFQADAAKPPPDDLDAYRCTLRFYAYRAAPDKTQHAEIRDCLESAVARYPSYVTAWAMLSIVYLDEARFRYNLKPGPTQPLERAMQAARRAVQLDPGNTRALQSLMTALFFDRQLDESLRVGEQALQTNPNDTELIGEYGTRLALGGQWKRGASFLATALSRNPGGGGYYHAMLALATYMQHDYQAALVHISQADLKKFPLFHMVAAAIYAERGMATDAGREAALFAEMRPQFVKNIVSELESRNLQPADQARLIASLRKAGLPIAVALATITSADGGSDLEPR